MDESELIFKIHEIVGDQEAFDMALVSEREVNECYVSIPTCVLWSPVRRMKKSKNSCSTFMKGFPGVF